MLIAFVQRGERAFLQDYPRLDFSDLTPAWGPDHDVDAESKAIAQSRPSVLARTTQRALQLWGYGIRGLAVRASRRLERWWRLR